MSKFLIEGGNKLSGEVKISGNKNAIFPCLAAALLTDEDVILRNIPNIVDTDVSLEILQSLGIEVTKHEDYIKINAHKIESHIIPEDLATKLRGSILFVGGLLGRVGKAEFIHPGGDIIGKRTIEPHLQGFEQLGFKVVPNDLSYAVTRLGTRPKKVNIFMEEASVTGTENLILASTLGDQTVVLKNCAMEPHVVDLCLMLIKMGAKIEGVGTSTLSITGVQNLKGVDFTIGSDFLELGTYSIAAAITKGDLKLTNCSLDNLEPVLLRLEKMGVKLTQVGNICQVTYSKLKAIPKLHTNIWPGFPTDLMSVMIVLATQANGVSLLHDWMYESRFFFVDKLISMGANITIADPHRIVVYGPTPLTARNLDTPDIRAGMALVLAALIAEGKSTINKAELIERGYEDVVGKLSNLGVSIEKID